MEDIVRAGYEQVAETYLARRDRVSNLKYVDMLVALLPAGARVLDVGCGAGVPVAQYLVSRGCTITGIDISAKQIELARREVPEGTFLVRSMSSLAASEYHVDAIVSIYAIVHIPREEHQALFRTLPSFLPSNGAILLVMPPGEWEGVEEFHGATMAWSHYDRKRNRQMLETAGFRVIFDEVDSSGDERYNVLLAQID